MFPGPALRSSSTAAAVVTSYDTTGLTAWFKPDDANYRTIETDNHFSQLRNAMGNTAYELVQNDAISRPQATVLKGRTVPIIGGDEANPAGFYFEGASDQIAGLYEIFGNFGNTKSISVMLRTPVTFPAREEMPVMGTFWWGLPTQVIRKVSLANYGGTGWRPVFVVYDYSSGWWGRESTGMVLQPNTWYHICWMLNAGVPSISINGTLQTMSSSDAILNEDNNHPNRVGAVGYDWGANSWFDGIVGDILIHNNLVLSQARRDADSTVSFNRYP